MTPKMIRIRVTLREFRGVGAGDDMFLQREAMGILGLQRKSESRIKCR